MTETRLLPTVYDHNAVTIGDPVTDYTSVTYTRVRSGAGVGSIVAPMGSAAMVRVLTAHGNFVPVRIPMVEVDDTGVEAVRDRFDGWVVDYTVDGDYGQKVVTANLVSVYAVLHAILAWTAPQFPLAVQPGYDVYVGPAITGILSYIQRNANRLGMPLITIAPPGPDTSYLMNWAARFVPIDELIKDTLPELDEWLDVRWWLPGDAPIPGYALTTATFVVEFVRPPTRTSTVFDERDGGVTASVAGKTPDAGIIYTGGKSPDWLNKVLADVANTFWPNFGKALADIFFPFQPFPNPDAAGWGVLAPREAVKTGGTAAYTVDSFQAGRQGMVDASGKRRVTWTFTNGRPFTYGTHFNLGDVIGGATELEPVDAAGEPIPIYDYVGSVTVADDRSSGLVVTATLGDDKPIQDWIAKTLGRIKNLQSMISTIFQGT